MRYLKIKLLSLTFICSFSSFSLYADVSPLQGAYFSIGAGAMNSRMNLSQNYSINGFGSQAPINIGSANNDVSSQFDAAGVVGLGYVYQINSVFALGGEFTADFEDVKAITQLSSVNPIFGGSVSNTFSTKLRNSFAFLVKPGILLNNGSTMVYGLAGPRWGNFETNDSFSTSTSVSALSSSGNSSQSNYKVGYTLGAGVEQSLTDHLSTGIEYQYTNYGHLSNFSSGQVVSTPTNIPEGTLMASSDVKMQTNLIELYLNYHF